MEPTAVQTPNYCAPFDQGARLRRDTSTPRVNVEKLGVQADHQPVPTPHGARPLAAVVAVVGLLAGTGVASAAEPGSCPNSEAIPTAANREQIETATMCLVNAERTARGLEPLRSNPRLERAARAHTDDMQARGHFSHTGSDGSTAGDRMRAAGYSAGGAQNLLKGIVTPADAVTLWLNSPSHRAKILEPAYRGIGTAQGGEYWTQSFGKAEPPGGTVPLSTQSALGGFPEAPVPEARAPLREPAARTSRRRAPFPQSSRSCAPA